MDILNNYCNFLLQTNCNIVMSNNISNTNTSFDYLRNSSEFLNLVLGNISTCILLLDQDMMLQAFNEPFRTIFSNKKDEDLLYKRCGEAIGCAHQVEEEKECGTTTHCQFCQLRESALLAYMNKTNVYKHKLSREFYKTSHEKELKHLQFSIRSFEFENEQYLILFIDDVTLLESQHITIIRQNVRINELLN